MVVRDDIAQVRDIPAALGLLSRLPVPMDMDHATQRGAKAAWAYPVAGIIIAVIAILVGLVAQRIGLPDAATAGLTLATLIIITGAMHEDGLADTADGFWGGWEKTRRLEIMKDSHIGTYGVIALVLSLGLRWLALTLLVSIGALWIVLLVAAPLSRAAMLAVMVALPHARDTGLSHAVGRPSATTVLIGTVCATLIALLVLQSIGLWIVVIAATALATLACAAIAHAKIGGQTGDVLGATQQITEITILLTLCAVLT